MSQIESDLLDKSSLGVTFDDIAALHDAKALLSEAVLLPLLVRVHVRRECAKCETEEENTSTPNPIYIK